MMRTMLEHGDALQWSSTSLRALAQSCSICTEARDTKRETETEPTRDLHSPRESYWNRCDFRKPKLANVSWRHSPQNDSSRSFTPFNLLCPDGREDCGLGAYAKYNKIIENSNISIILRIRVQLSVFPRYVYLRCIFDCSIHMFRYARFHLMSQSYISTVKR